MPANGFDSLLISARPQFPSGTFALIDWENGRMEFSIGTVYRLKFAGGPEQADQRILNDPIGSFHPPMIFVCTYFMRANLIENPAITHDRRRLDIADLKRDGETSTRGRRRR